MRRVLLAAALCLTPALALAQAQYTPAPPVPMNFPQPPVWTMNQAVHAVTITPGTTLFAPTKAIFVAGTSGGAACVLHMTLAATGDTAQTYSNVQPGETLSVEAIQILSDTTTCVGIIAWY